MSASLLPFSLNLVTAPRAVGIVPHETWRQTRAALLERAGSGPRTVALLGDAGTGKSWLLRDLASVLRQQGRAVVLLGQGDLPWRLASDTILLIDEASRLDAASLAALAAQRTTSVILADVPRFGESLSRHTPSPAIIRFPSMSPRQVAAFVHEWLLRSGRASDSVTQEGVARLAVLSGGTPRLITQLLNAAFALAGGSGPISGAALDEVATLRWNGPVAATRPAPVAPAPGNALRRAAMVAGLTALAASIALGLRASSPLRWDDSADPERRLIEAAFVPEAMLAPRPPGMLATLAQPEPVRADPPPHAIRPEPVLLQAPPAPIADIPPPVDPAEIVDTVAFEDAGPGLILLARHGDTLRALYASLYRGVDAPPFAAVIAANPRPVVPGAVVIFPAPAGGWPRP